MNEFIPFNFIFSPAKSGLITKTTLSSQKMSSLDHSARCTVARTFSMLSEMTFVSCITCWLSVLYSSISR